MQTIYCVLLDGADMQKCNQFYIDSEKIKMATVKMLSSS